MTTLLRRRQVEDRLGLKTSAVYRLISLGLLPRPVKITERAVGWPANEIDAVIQARIAGLPDEAIRRLVAKLTKNRAKSRDDLVT
jgi:prophage regulatory protein